MVRMADKLKKYMGPNPFGANQSRSFSDKKVTSEFFPVSLFWTLFNDQHEILLGTRGSGKTFLLKMMRYSMLKRIADPKAQKLVADKRFIAIYVPMYLEFVTSFNDTHLSEENRITFFQFGFNCKLAEALITELESILDDIQDVAERTEKMMDIVEYFYKVWFGKQRTEIFDFRELSQKIHEMYYNINWNNTDLENAPEVFKKPICTPLLAVKSILNQVLELDEPTWIVCVDEAEFLNESLQKCINSVFRSDSDRIILKVATLPYYHVTLETLVPNVPVSNGNDFSYRVVDLDYSSEDFIAMTNKLCSHRLEEMFDEEVICPDLESFLGKVGNDDQIDYYRLEVKEENSTREIIERKIIDSFPPTRRKNAINYNNKRKTIYDKYAPIFFVREMYHLTRKGHYIPGWYAGAQNIRKLSQGNPRIYIQIMHDLFEKARETSLSAKAQHSVVMNFAKIFCQGTEALVERGPVVYKELNKIAKHLHEKVHGDYLKTTSSSFVLKYQQGVTFEECKGWLELAVAYSRIAVDDETKIYGIKEDTKFGLSNIYAMAYWVPIRNDRPETIKIMQNESNSYTVKKGQKVKQEWQQLTLFDEVTDD